MIEEQAVLAALPATLEDTPCVADPDPGPPEVQEPVLILIDALGGDHTVQMRVKRPRPGQPAEIQAGRDNALRRVHQRVDGDRDPVRAPAMGEPGGATPRSSWVSQIMRTNDVEKRWYDPVAFRAASVYVVSIIAMAGLAFALFLLIGREVPLWALGTPIVLLVGGIGALVKT